MFRLLLLWTVLELSFLFVTAEQQTTGEKLWEQDLTNEMRIGLATGGYSRVVLECSADWIAFVVTLEEDFHGVVYTRGSFHKQNSPCFLDAQGGVDFALKVPYDDCNVKHDSEMGGYTTTVIVQHDKDLITPGDLGFTLLCKDEKEVTASIAGMKSRISLVGADPSAKSNLDGALSAMSPSNIVTLTPPKVELKAKSKQEEL